MLKALIRSDEIPFEDHFSTIFDRTSVMKVFFSNNLLKNVNHAK